MTLRWMRITVAEPTTKAGNTRHGCIRVTSSDFPGELWAGWHGLLERLDELDELPAHGLFRVAEEP